MAPHILNNNFKESSEVKWEFILVSYILVFTYLLHPIRLFIYFILVFVGIILLLSIVAAQKKKNSKTGSKGAKKQDSRSTKENCNPSCLKVR